jgi:hypothetical protein
MANRLKVGFFTDPILAVVTVSEHSERQNEATQLGIVDGVNQMRAGIGMGLQQLRNLRQRGSLSALSRLGTPNCDVKVFYCPLPRPVG